MDTFFPNKNSFVRANVPTNKKNSRQHEGDFFLPPDQNLGDFCIVAAVCVAVVVAYLPRPWTVLRSTSCIDATDLLTCPPHPHPTSLASACLRGTPADSPPSSSPAPYLDFGLSLRSKMLLHLTLLLPTRDEKEGKGQEKGGRAVISPSGKKGNTTFPRVRGTETLVLLRKEFPSSLLRGNNTTEEMEGNRFPAVKLRIGAKGKN